MQGLTLTGIIATEKHTSMLGSTQVVDRRMYKRMDRRKFEFLYRTSLEAGATKITGQGGVKPFYKKSTLVHVLLWFPSHDLSQLMRLWYLSHRRPAKAQVSLRICAVSPEPFLFAHMKYGSRRSVQLKIRHLSPLDGCACAFEERVYGG